MSHLHEDIQEESILLALGHTPDIPVMDIVEHLAVCDECRQLVREVNETAGRLPEALDQVSPPTDLRERILQLAVSENEPNQGPERLSSPVDSGPIPLRRRTHFLRSRLPVGAIAWTVILVLLIAGNGALLWRTQSQQSALLTLQSRYESDLNWLRSAEYLLISGEPPAYSGELQSLVTQGEPLNKQSEGRATVYYTQQSRVYLLMQADGLSQTTPHSIWLHEDGEKHHVGDFISTSTGRGSYVYTTNVSEWERLSSHTVVLGVRDESTQQPILIGTLQHTHSNKSEKL